MRKLLILLTLAAIGLASCNGGYKKGENGLLYNKYTDKPGPKIKAGDYICFNIIVKNDQDSIIKSSYDFGAPETRYMTEPPYKGTVVDAMKLLAEGDSISVKISIDSVAKKSYVPPSIKGKFLIYDIKIEKLISKGNLTDDEFQTRVGKFVQSLDTKIKDSEPVKIKKYIDDNKLQVTKTDSGLYYTITTKGTGPLPISGDTIVMNYSGRYVATGKLFDSNIPELAAKEKLSTTTGRVYAPIHIPVGEGNLMPGLQAGLSLLNKGSRATFIIPSKLAYGAEGNANIGPYSPLVFEVELLNIIHRDPNAKPQMIIPRPGYAPVPIQ